MKSTAGFCEHAMGEAVGREYVAKYFPPEAKAAAEELVVNLKSALHTHRASHVDVPGNEGESRVKMANFTAKIGYPDQVARLLRPFVRPRTTPSAMSDARQSLRACTGSLAKIGQAPSIAPTGT